MAAVDVGDGVDALTGVDLDIIVILLVIASALAMALRGPAALYDSVV